MIGEKPSTDSRLDRPSAMAALSALIRDFSRALIGWGCLIAASLTCFWLTEGTRYHPLSVGILMSSSILFVLMALFESLWRLLVDDRS